MAHKFKLSMLHVQDFPDAGLLIRFRKRRIIGESDLQRTRRELRTLLAPERLVLLDLSNVEVMSSAIIGLLVKLRRKLQRMAGHLSLCGLPPQIQQIFSVTRLDQTFDIYPDLETALGGSAADAV